MNDQAIKADDGKPRVDLVSPYLIEAVGYIRGYGAKKYGDSENWQQVEKERYIAAALRHFCEVMKDFESIDKESGYPHLWHCACNINFLVEMLEKEKKGKPMAEKIGEGFESTTEYYLGENY